MIASIACDSKGFYNCSPTPENNTKKVSFPKSQLAELYKPINGFSVVKLLYKFRNIWVCEVVDLNETVELHENEFSLL